ncbi:hypothetical protein A2U01_0094340 [Trifolium medium]|uniref:Uncharacterized protein n=1 Tax=Trifolium medium TaxID=97028 RepID=A0A392UKU7_9FABA|nr:hypothetical protein [Trifolium medium]
MDLSLVRPKLEAGPDAGNGLSLGDIEILSFASRRETYCPFVCRSRPATSSDSI